MAGGPVGGCGIELEWVNCGTVGKLLCGSSSDDGCTELGVISASLISSLISNKGSSNSCC